MTLTQLDIIAPITTLVAPVIVSIGGWSQNSMNRSMRKIGRRYLSPKRSRKEHPITHITTGARIPKILLLPLAVVAILGLYTYGAFEQMQDVNLDRVNVDQSAYMNYGRKLRESGYTHVGNRNRMPVYPLLLSRIYQPGMSDEAYFFRGKVFNVLLSLVVLAGVLWIFTREISKFLAINLVLVIMFGVFMYKAGYVQVELLFYGINFLLFVLMWRMLRSPHPTYQSAVVVGVVAGLAHLTKASILPGLLLFLGFGLIKWGVRTESARRRLPSQSLTATIRSLQPTLSSILAFLLVGVMFLIVVSPYIITSKRVFGRYFYNVNSTFYMWYESWEEASEGTKAHGDREGWPDMPASEIPSPQKYLHEHTLGQILHRFYTGGLKTWESVRTSYGYHIYLYVYGPVFILGVIANRKRVWTLIRRDSIPYLFLTAYFLAYGLLYAWYAWITWGNRFVLSQFTPLLFVIGVGIDRLLHAMDVERKPTSPPLPALFMLNLIMFGFTISHILTVLVANIEVVSGAA
jgi:hypothetical protein